MAALQESGAYCCKAACAGKASVPYSRSPPTSM